MDNLTRDYIGLIAKWLAPVDIARWSRAFPKWKHVLKSIFFSRVKTSIDDHIRSHFEQMKTLPKKGGTHPADGTYKEFVTAMGVNRGAISGSFVLQMILGEQWESDIDIYVPTSDVPEIYGEHAKRNNFAPVNDVDIVLWAKHDDEHWECGRYVPDSLIRVRNFKSPGLKMMQVIAIEGYVYPYIDRFDFDVVKNAFWYDENGSPQVKVGFLSSIVKMAFVFDKTAYLERNLWMMRGNMIDGRIEKYRERGFTIEVI